MENNLIAGIGEVLWDIFPEYKQLGGATANFAYHTSQFGFNATVVSALGCDPLGDEIEHSGAASRPSPKTTTGYSRKRCGRAHVAFRGVWARPGMEPHRRIGRVTLPATGLRGYRLA